MAAGAGWLWAAHAPYVAVSPGIRAGGRVRFLADVDLALARFPYDFISGEYVNGIDGGILTVLSRSSEHEWRTLVSVRAGVEVRVRRRRLNGH